ncbi:hypothetical protein O3M35_003121 [Rhynocoris fuscipes]
MNKDDQVINSAVIESQNRDNLKADSLINQIPHKENGKKSTTTEKIIERPVITVPPDSNAGIFKKSFDNEDTELIVETPDGQERRFFYNQPLKTIDLRDILHEVCRSVGIDEEMEAIIPDCLDTHSSSDNEKSDNDEGEVPIKTNGGNGTLSSASDGVQNKVIREGDIKRRKCQRKHKKLEEPVCLTISSDEEDNGKNGPIPNGVASEVSVTTELSKKEPNITEDTESPEEAITRGVAGGGMDFSELLDSPDVEKALMQCRTVRIGSYKVVPEEKVVLSEYGIKLKVPSPKGEPVTIKILKNEIVKVLAHFGKSMPVLFYYTTSRAGMKVRTTLKMMTGNGNSAYFDPTSKVEMHKRIILFPDKLTDETRLFIKDIYDSQCLLEDLSSQEADEILLRVAPKDTPTQIKKDVQNTSAITPSNIQTIMVYPPPPTKGGISINTEDYACLGEDQFLNDVIIDFYLKFLVQTKLSEFDQKRTHVFSSFFYKRLTTKCSPHSGGGHKYQDDPKLSPAEKRHARVKGWTKSVDLFSKDFIIIPINESSHWFLGIICFPGLTSAVRMSDNTPVPNPMRRKPKAGNITVLSGGQAPATIGATTITMVHPAPEPTITVEHDEDRDEAEGDDDDLEPNTSDEEASKDPQEDLLDDATHKAAKTSKQPDPAEPIKQPCILIFDSLAGASRSRVCATLREYLEVEYKVRHKGRKRDFSAFTFRGAVPKVPQQTNYTDCGLYVLQYVETFFEKPITNYRMPIKELKDWFTPDIVSRKRYEIQQLLHRLMEEQNVDIARLNLPNLGLHPDGTTSHLQYSDEGEMEDELEEEEGEIEGEENEHIEDEMNVDEEMETDIHETEHTDEEEITTTASSVATATASAATTTTSSSTITATTINERTNEYFVDNKTILNQLRHLDKNVKIEPININETIHTKRKLPTTATLKDLRSPRLINRHSQVQDNKKMRCE